MPHTISKEERYFVVMGDDGKPSDILFNGKDNVTTTGQKFMFADKDEKPLQNAVFSKYVLNPDGSVKEEVPRSKAQIIERTKGMVVNLAAATK